MRASQLLLDRSNDVVHAKSVPCECKKWNDFGSQWTAHDLAKRIYDDSPLLQPGNEDFCQVEKSLGCRAAVLGERNSAFARGSGWPQFPGFPEYEVGDTPVSNPSLAVTAMAVTLVVREPSFSWLPVVKVFKIKKNLLFATTVNRQQ